MNMPLEALLDRIFYRLRQLGSVIPGRRRAGLLPDEVQSAIHSLGLDVPDELLNVYTCCDGTSTYEGDDIGKIQFFPGFYWMSLADALQVYHAISKGGDWNRAWLPIFANGGGDFYAVVCDEASPYFGEVVGFVLGEPDQIIEFKNIVSMLETIERAFADGAFFASEGMLKADYPKMRAISRQLQRGFMEHGA